MGKADELTQAHVAICDDSITNVMILSKLVETVGMGNIHSFTDPRRLLSHIGEHHKAIDLLILDIEMPHMNGLEVMERLQQGGRGGAFFPILVITGLQEREVRHQALLGGANDFINKPFDQEEVTLRVKNLLRLQQALRLRSSLAQHLESEVQRRTQALNRAVESLVHCMALAGEMRDNETGLHVTRVGRYSRLLAEGMGLPPELCFMIEKAAPLHDIGKIGIPDSILHKNGRLDETERLAMNQHTSKGAELLAGHDSTLIQLAAGIAASHHEKWDGSGYPRGLKGESIPIEGRIVAVADVFDALTTARPYKEPWPAEQAVGFIREHAGSHFDPGVVQAFSARCDEILSIMEGLRG
jgi:putative two-component system response regulator